MHCMLDNAISRRVTVLLWSLQFLMLRHQISPVRLSLPRLSLLRPETLALPLAILIFMVNIVLVL
jgi:hypothetical protein